MTDEVQEVELDFDAPFEAPDRGQEAVQEEQELVIEKTSKENLRDIQDIYVAIIKKEMLEQAKMGVYDTKLMGLAKDLLKNNDVGLDDGKAGALNDALINIRAKSKAHVKDHKEESRQHKLN